MKNTLSKLLPLLLLLLFAHAETYAYVPRTKKSDAKYRYISEEQIIFAKQSKYTSPIDKRVRQPHYKYQQILMRNYPFPATPDYTARTPFQETNTNLFSAKEDTDELFNDIFASASPMMRASATTDDDELPGEPGQMPIGDGMWLLLGVISLYTLVKRKHLSNLLKLSNMKKISLLFALLFTLISQIQSEPYIRDGGGLGKYGYFEKDAVTATSTPFWVANGGYENIYRYGVRSWINGNENNYVYSSIFASCNGGDAATDNFNLSLNTGSTVHSSVFVEYCGPSYSHGNMSPTNACFNERSFFVMDLVPKTDALSSEINKTADNNVVLTFTLSNNNTSGQYLNRLWISNDGTAVETTDIQNGAFWVYYEAATGSETFDGTETSKQLYGNYNGNSTSDNSYGHDALGISIPQNTTGGLRCYVVLKGSLLNSSAIGKTIRMSIIADGINITPNRDSNYSLMKLDKTQPSTSYLTVANSSLYYRSKATPVAWNSPSNWETSTTEGGTYTSAVLAPSAATIAKLTVTTGHTLEVSNSIATPVSTNFIVNGILEMKSGAVVSTAPTYGASSTLKYNTGGNITTGNEWTADATTLGAGCPQNVEVASGTVTIYIATTETDPNGTDIMESKYYMVGNLNVLNEATLYLDMRDGAKPWNQKGLNITGDINNAGAIQMSSDCHQALSCDNFTNTGQTTLSSHSNGGDLYITGNFNNNAANASNVNINGRALIMTGDKDQTVGGSATGTYEIDYFIVSKNNNGKVVTLQHNLLADGEGNGQSGGGAVTVEGAILDISGRTVQIARNSSGYYSTITTDANGSIRTNVQSKLYILGDESSPNVGTLRFDQSIPGTTNVIGVFRLNRSNAQAQLNVANDFIVRDSLKIQQGKLNSSANIILDSACTATLSSTNTTAALTVNNLIFTRSLNNTAEFYKNGRTLTINGKVRTKVHFARLGKWHFISFPYAATLKKSDGITDATIGSGANGGDCAVYWYDPAKRATNVSGWTQFTGTSLEKDKGYIIAKREGTDAFDLELYFDSNVDGTDGMFNSTASRTLTFTENGSSVLCNEGWNFIAHPLSAAAQPSLTNGEFAYNYDPSLDTYKLWYYAYNAGYTYGSSSFKPFTSFFVKTPDATTLGLSYSGYSNPQGVVRRKIVVQSAESETIIPLYLTVNSVKYETLVRVIPDATTGQDALYDAPYTPPMSSATPRLYSLIGSIQYALNSVPLNSTVPVALRVPAAGIYGFSWISPTNNVRATLTDTQTSTVTDMTTASSYEFDTSTSGDISNRFYINILQPVPTSIDIEKGGNIPFDVFAKNREIMVEKLTKDGVVALYDMGGKLLQKQSVIADRVTLRVPIAGVYILSVTNKSGNYRIKVIGR